MGSLNNKKYYLFEQERIDTFATWKFSDNKPCNKNAMAKAGFYKISADEGDGCACFFCGKTLDEWASNDDPFQEHKSHSPSCKFINLGRPEAQLKVSEFLDLIQAWVVKKLDKAMDRENEQFDAYLTDIMSKMRNSKK